MSENNGRREVTLSLQAALAVASLLFVVFGAGWTLFQSQFTYVAKDIEQIRADLARRESELKEQVLLLSRTVESRRGEFLNQDEFRQYERRVVDLTTRLEQRIAAHEASTPSRESVMQLFNAHNAHDRDSDAALRRELDVIHRELDTLLHRVTKP